MDRTLKALPFVLAAVLSIVLAVAAASASAVAANATPAKVTPVQAWCNATALYFKTPTTAHLDGMLNRSEVLPWLYYGLDSANVYFDKRDGQWSKYGNGDLKDLRETFGRRCLVH